MVELSNGEGDYFKINCRVWRGKGEEGGGFYSNGIALSGLLMLIMFQVLLSN